MPDYKMVRGQQRPMGGNAFARGAQMALQAFQAQQRAMGQGVRSEYMQELMRKMQFEREQMEKRQRAIQQAFAPTTETIPAEIPGVPDITRQTPSAGMEALGQIYGNPAFAQLAAELMQAGAMEMPEIPTAMKSAQVMAQIAKATKPDKKSFENLMTENIASGMPISDALWDAWRRFQEMKKVPSTSVTIKHMPGAQVEQTAKLQNFRNMLTRIGENFDKSFTGPKEGRIGAIRNMLGVDPQRLWGKKMPSDKRQKEIIFRQLVKQLGDDLLRLRSGAQINEQEYERMKEFMPGINQPDDVFLGNLQSLMTTFDQIIEDRSRIFESAGYVPPRLPTSLEMKRHRQEMKQHIEGKSKKLDKETARSILMEAGGDKEKAREIARQRGYEF